MGTDYRFRKNHFFYLSFLSINVEPIIPSSGRLILIKNLLLLVKPIFWLVEIFFRYRLLLCMTNVTVSYRNKLLMQNIVPANTS